MATPQPRYSAEHKSQAITDNMPLFTFDIWWHKTGRRHTTTGVLNAEDATHIMGIMRRAINGDKP